MVRLKYLKVFAALCIHLRHCCSVDDVVVPFAIAFTPRTKYFRISPLTTRHTLFSVQQRTLYRLNSTALLFYSDTCSLSVQCSYTKREPNPSTWNVFSVETISPSPPVSAYFSLLLLLFVFEADMDLLAGAKRKRHHREHVRMTDLNNRNYTVKLGTRMLTL